MSATSTGRPAVNASPTNVFSIGEVSAVSSSAPWPGATSTISRRAVGGRQDDGHHVRVGDLPSLPGDQRQRFLALRGRAVAG